MENNHIKLLVFDWDGTLADSASAIVDAMQSAIRELSLDSRSDQDIRNIIGLGLMEAVNVLFPELNVSDLESLANKYRHQYVLSNQGKTRLFPRTQETLQELKNLDYQMAIATGKSRKGLDNSLRDTGIGDYFHFTRCADETFSKPHPQMLLDIMDNFAIEPGNAVMIGDSEYDMQMATSAGVRSIAVSYGSQNRERLLEYKPDACLDCISELVHWLSAYH